MRDKKNLKLINKYDKNKKSLIYILLIAFIAGVILNFMPCVLPVLLLKIFNFLEKREENKKEIIIISLSTIAGIITTFLTFAALAISFKLLGKNIGWGIHFQEPLFIAFLAIIVTLFAANIFEYFTISIDNFINKRINNIGASNNKILQHFCTGILVTLLATPCSAPFLGTAIAFALTTNSLNILLILLMIALGLSFPYILLVIYPKFLYLLPRPGKWMVTLKKILGLFLIATAIWLIFILNGQIGIFGAIIFAAELFLVFYFLKYKEKVSLLFGKKFFSFLVILNLLIALFIAGNFSKTLNKVSLDNSIWLDYNQTNISKLIAEDKIIFVNITADWCLTCKYNEIFVLNKKNIIELFNDPNIRAIKADYTSRDDNIRELLESVNRYGIPTYIIYSKNHPNGLVLGEILTSKNLIKLIEDEKLLLKNSQ